MPSVKDFQIGQQVVLCFSKGTPITCNTVNSPKHPSRVVVSKIGRSRVYVECGGTKFQPVSIDFTEKYHTIVPIDQAKEDYRLALEAREEQVMRDHNRNILTPGEINKLVAAL